LQRFDVLDGFRAFSILLVLGAHMLPLGPRVLSLNGMSGYMGMSLFFALSGFLITHQLHARREVAAFFIRRAFRIVPLAWVVILIGAWLSDADAMQVFLSMVFAQSYVQEGIVPGLEHFWSLCVEVHFYLFVGGLMLVTRFRGFMVLPVAWVIVLASRLLDSPSGGIQTHARVDEILSGALLALVWLGRFGPHPARMIARVPPLVLLGLLVLACHPQTPAMHGARGLFAAMLMGRALFAEDPSRWRWLAAKPLRYVAEISYALYVFHPLSMHGWLGSDSSPILKYLKRVLCFAITFAAAHLSTRYFERHFINLAKRMTARRRSETLGGESAAARAK
jgi:peptidoglycan/LPS O-acetylase OafA/YrhL